MANNIYHSILASRHEAYLKALDSGKVVPFVYPWDAMPGLILLLALLTVPLLPPRYRILVSMNVFAWTFYFCTSTMLKARCLGFAGGYGIGLVCAWGLIMTVVLLFCRDIGTELQRIEWRDVPLLEPDQPSNHTNGALTTSAKALQVDSAGKRRVWGVDGPALARTPAREDESPASSPYSLVWQGYPSSLWHRIEWNIDLMTSFRGVGWNWRIPTLPPLDIPIKDPDTRLKPSSSAANSIVSSHVPTNISKSTLRQLQRTALRDFILHYFALDLLKTIMITDPYFLGAADLSSPSPWPVLSQPTTLANFLTKLARLYISMTGVISALTFIFSLSPLFFTLILPALLNPKHLTSIPLLEPSLYPPYWLPLASVARSGLAGLWGKWWHQMFRFGISEPSRACIARWDMDPKGQAARLLQLAIAFGLSGAIHASASFTTFSASSSRPLTGPLAFFLLQGLGVALQTALSTTVPLPEMLRAPWLRRSANVGFVLLWGWVTGPLLADDFARCGIWLFEPVPISLFRGVLWGDWLVWRDMRSWAGWHRGSTWYQTGIAIY